MIFSDSSRLESLSGGRLDGRKLVRFIFVDEAGTTKNNVHTVVAGVVVHGDSELIPLEDRLDEIAEKFIPKEELEGFVFHMTDLWHGAKYWRRDKWPREKRREIAREVISVVRHLELPVLFGMTANSVAEERYPELKDNKSRNMMYSHSIAFMGCTFIAEDWMRKAFPEEVVQIVSEDHDQTRKYIREAHNIFRNPAEVKRRGLDERFLPLTKIRNGVLFADKNESKALQIADACAFFIRMHLRGDVQEAEEFYELIKPWMVVLPKGEQQYVPPIRERYRFGPLVEVYGE